MKEKAKMRRGYSAGFTLMSVIVSCAILGVFAVSVAGMAFSAYRTTVKTDATSFFDQRNQAAISEFKANPDPTYLKTVEPFSGMTYDEARSAFVGYYDANLQATSEDRAVYRAEYSYEMLRAAADKYSFEDNTYILQLSNSRKDERSGWVSFVTGSSNLESRIHTNVLDLNLTNPSDPTVPTPPERSTYNVTFLLSGGTFADTANNRFMKVVLSNSELGKAIAELEGRFSANTAGERFSGWTKAGTTDVVDKTSTEKVRANLTLTGSFAPVPVVPHTVTFEIPFYTGSSIPPSGSLRADYKVKNGETVLGDPLAVLFGRPSYRELMENGAILEGWFDKATGTEFKVGATAVTADWNGKTVVARVKTPVVATNVPIELKATLTGKFWEITASDLNFVVDSVGGERRLFLTVKQRNEDLWSPSDDTATYRYDLGSVKSIQEKIKNKEAEQEFKLTLSYNYYDVAKIIKEDTFGRVLLYNGMKPGGFPFRENPFKGIRNMAQFLPFDADPGKPELDNLESIVGLTGEAKMKLIHNPIAVEPTTEPGGTQSGLAEAGGRYFMDLRTQKLAERDAPMIGSRPTQFSIALKDEGVRDGHRFYSLHLYNENGVDIMGGSGKWYGNLNDRHNLGQELYFGYGEAKVTALESFMFGIDSDGFNIRFQSESVKETAVEHPDGAIYGVEGYHTVFKNVKVHESSDVYIQQVETFVDVRAKDQSVPNGSGGKAVLKDVAVAANPDGTLMYYGWPAGHSNVGAFDSNVRGTWTWYDVDAGRNPRAPRNPAFSATSTGGMKVLELPRGFTFEIE